MSIKSYIEGNSLTILKNIHVFLLFFIVVVILLYGYGCVTNPSTVLAPGPSQEPHFRVIPQEPSTSTWVGDDGRTYTIEWGEPKWQTTTN
jgi:hypothetical protein